MKKTFFETNFFARFFFIIVEKIEDSADVNLVIRKVIAALGDIPGNHVHAVIRNATIPSDVLHFTRENDLVGEVMAPKDGFVEIPETPGLGVELDMKAVEKYRVG